ncbi:hypothetical protein VV208B2_31610 [Vibrio vulnificus]|nr:hypothetical protein VV208B2_31610 [Vibrio vulnificus]
MGIPCSELKEKYSQVYRLSMYGECQKSLKFKKNGAASLINIARLTKVAAQ